MARARGEYLTQPWRIVAFIINVAIFYAVHYAITGDWRITGGGQSLWFMSAVGWWALGLLSAPWYTPPRDAIAASAGALLALVTLDLSTAVSLKDVLPSARTALIIYAAIVLVSGTIASLLKYGGRHERTRRVFFAIADRFAKGEVLLGSAAILSIFGFYADLRVVLLLTTLWFTFALVRPVEFGLQLALRTFAAIARREDVPPVGIVQRVDHPDIVRVSLNASVPWKQERLHIACLPGGRVGYLIPLFSQIQGSEIVGTGFCVGDATTVVSDYETGDVYVASNGDQLPSLISGLCGSDDAEIVGFVVEGSTIGTIQFEASRERGLQEGYVVFCNLPTGRVYFQVLDAHTREESFHNNPRGTHIVQAAQLGTHSAEHGFKKYPWLPPMNAPVFRLSKEVELAASMKPGEFVIGKVPSTNMGLHVSLPELVAYHTAVLGVTGTGKTELVLDIVKEALRQDTKVFCVDLTGEYSKRLKDHNPVAMGLTQSEGDDLEKKLFDAETGAYGAGPEKKVLKTFLDGLRDKARERIRSFLESKENSLAVFELAEVTNTRATLRTTELFLSEIMLWARQHRKARRVLIVLEEAHTIIPETAGAGFDYDTQWVVGRIGQIALQGRKYGVGLLIVSQRTALVSKTILSQCNTYFTHALVDQTSLNYLSNVYSDAHVKAIPNLRFLEFFAYGRAVKSERPLLVHREFDETKAVASRSLDEPVAAGSGEP